jgi:drug/metabolite transporter (DMT)-like permease
LFALALLLPAARLHPPRLARLPRPVVVWTVAAYAATLVLFVAATTLTTAANAILLQYTAPAWIIFFSLLGGERPRLRDLALTAGCFAGLGLFFLDSISAEGRQGIALALLSGCAMGTMTVGLRRLGRDREGSSAVIAIVGGNMLCVLVAAPWMITAAPRLSASAWAILACLGIFQIALPYLLFSAGVRHVPALRATLLAMLEPLLNPVWVALVTGEVPGTGTVLGGGLILLCLAIDAVLPRGSDGAEPIA